MRILEWGEVERLEPCLKELAAHHNAVSLCFPGAYPRYPFAETLARFRREIESGKSVIAVTENGGEITGFAKADVENGRGKLDFLVVARAYRGRGLGGELMAWAMNHFAQSGVTETEVKVVDGNDALGFYERYGFRMNAHILLRAQEK